MFIQVYIVEVADGRQIYEPAVYTDKASAVSAFYDRLSDISGCPRRTVTRKEAEKIEADIHMRQRIAEGSYACIRLSERVIELNV